jgi:hypothetical protein
VVVTSPATVIPVPGRLTTGQDEQQGQETMSTTSRYAGQAQLDAAVAALWQAVRVEHDELPETAPVLNARYPGEAAPATAAAVATSLLREAVHELAEARGVTVTSRGGRYHNKTFAQFAAELGLLAEGDYKARGGFAEVSLPAETETRYAAELDAIDRVLAEHPVPAPEPRTAKKSDDGGRKVTAVCGCTPAHRIWLSRTTLEQQVVMCSRCAREGRDPLFVDAATLGV